MWNGKGDNLAALDFLESDLVLIGNKASVT
jgi:hypothetical protein